MPMWLVNWVNGMQKAFFEICNLIKIRGQSCGYSTRNQSLACSNSTTCQAALDCRCWYMYRVAIDASLGNWTTCCVFSSSIMILPKKRGSFGYDNEFKMMPLPAVENLIKDYHARGNGTVLIQGELHQERLFHYKTRVGRLRWWWWWWNVVEWIMIVFERIRSSVKKTIRILWGVTGTCRYDGVTK